MKSEDVRWRQKPETREFGGGYFHAAATPSLSMTSHGSPSQPQTPDFSTFVSFAIFHANPTILSSVYLALSTLLTALYSDHRAIVSVLAPVEGEWSHLSVNNWAAESLVPVASCPPIGKALAQPDKWVSVIHAWVAIATSLQR